MDTTLIGPHIRIEGNGTVQGSQMYRGGQNNTLGAYPYHLHMLGNGTGSYFTDNSVYK